MEKVKVEKHHHHILSVKFALTVGIALLILTVITVWIANFDFGRFNTLIAMLVATVKASLVVLFFMNLWYDNKENLVIFGSSFLFLAIFGILTATDLWFRGDVLIAPGQSIFKQIEGKAKFSKPWNPTPELVAYGQQLYQAQCVSCHGAEGRGNGPAAGALNPPPRNFHEAGGWTNARTPIGVYKTLTEGIQGTSMASYSNLPSEDRWALAYYVLDMGPDYPKVQETELASVGIDPTKEGGGAQQAAPSIPVDFAIERMAVDKK